MDEARIEYEAQQETTKSAEELIKDCVREANTLPPEKPASEEENLDIVKHLIKRLAIHQIVLEKKANETNRLLLFLSIVSVIAAVIPLLSLFGHIGPIKTNALTIGGLFIISLFLAFIKYGSLANSYNRSPWQIKFVEIWNDFFNFFLTTLIAYYFISIRWPSLLKGETLSTSDFVLFFIFTLGIFGHLCVVSKNITDGIEVILKKILEK